MEKEQFDGLRKGALALVSVSLLITVISAFMTKEMNYGNLGRSLFQLAYLGFFSPATRGHLAKITWVYVLIVIGVIFTVIFVPVGVIMVVLYSGLSTGMNIILVLLTLLHVTETIIFGTYFHKVRGFAKLNEELKTELV